MNTATTSELSKLMKPEINIVSEARKIDGEIGSLLNDIAQYVVKGDNRRAAQAAAYLLITLAKKSAQKPFTLLRKANR